MRCRDRAAARAEEVEVFGLVPPDSALDKHSVVGDAALHVALTTEDAALEATLVDALAFSGVAAVFEDVLDAHEEFTVDDRFVASVEGFVLVGDLADVVTVAQEQAQFRGRYFARGS